MASDPPEIYNAVEYVWSQDYPLGYWVNRINKINRFNFQDSLEAIVVLFQLVDLYVHILTAKLVNPYYQWYMLKEELKPNREIHNTLGPLREEVTEDLLLDPEAEHMLGREWIFLEKVAEEIDQFQGIEIPEEVQENDLELEWIAVDILGCPTKTDESGSRIPQDDPEQYIGYCNAVLNFWADNLEVWNDIKHGFRVLPLDWNTLEAVDEQAKQLGKGSDFEELKRQYQNQDDDWSLQFYRMDTSDSEGMQDVDIVVYEADLDGCVSMARVSFGLLANLFNRETRFDIGAMMEQYLGFPEERQRTLIERQFTITTEWYSAEE